MLSPPVECVAGFAAAADLTTGGRFDGAFGGGVPAQPEIMTTAIAIEIDFSEEAIVFTLKFCLWTG